MNGKPVNRIAALHDNPGCGFEPVAIVGIGCRFPGAADGPREFWKLLANGVDAVREAPANRPGFAELFDADPRKPGRTYTRWGGFLDRVDLFDAHFFGISPREASRIDPQQRLLLELVWEACEDAGLPPTRLAGSRTGVFIGISTHDYGDMQMYPWHRNDIDLHSNSGTATSIAANRISYIYDLRGPSVAVDTACSSALTAVHLACQSLRTADCDLAIVGGVQMVLTPELTIGFCKASMLSRDGKCNAFDASANGYVRGEGGGVVLLKPLRTALESGDLIHAVIRATAVNQDGHTTSMTVPSRDAQQAMLEEALAKAGLSPRDVQYVEAHGPGTPVGDPIEANAIGRVMSQGRREGEFCAIGSVKTNIGHLEAASGIAGLIKVALALRHRQIPPSLHFQHANEAIDFDALRLRVVTAREPWPEPEKPAIAGVNSFGFGGANAHVLLQEPPAIAETVSGAPGANSGPQLLALSARSPEALLASAVAYSRHLQQSDSPSLQDICYTAAQRRAHHDYRLAVVAGNAADMAESLSAFASGELRFNIASGRCSSVGAPKIGFVFSGMGPQWWAMGRQLLDEEPVFRSAIERCDQALRKHADWSLLAEFAADENTSRVALPEFAQVTNFAIQVALAELWSSFGIRPDAVMGHSGGAMAAAYVAGVYDLEDALRLSFHRSRLQGRPSNEGRMLAVGAPFDEVSGLLDGTGDRISLAAINGPSAITLAGEGDALERIFTALQEKQIFTRFLPVTIAYHSPVMDKIRDEFLACVPNLHGRTARIRLVSDTTGTLANGSEFNAEYWWRAIRQPVLFWEGIKQLLSGGVQHIVEISPHPVLSSSMVECLKKQDVKGLVLPSLRRKENEREIMLRSLGALYTVGCSPNWAAIQQKNARFVPVPGYPWQRERHWFEPAARPGNWSETAAGRPASHPLLGSRLRSARPTWESAVGENGTEYLKDHLVQGAAVFPGAAYVEQMLAAGAAMDGQARLQLCDIEFIKPLILNPGAPTAVQLTLDPEDQRFGVFSAGQNNADSWICHARGSFSTLNGHEEQHLDLAALKQSISKPVETGDFYGRMAERGLAYGPVFRGIQNLWTADRQALGFIRATNLEHVENHIVHPALLDAAFQLLVAAAETDAALAGERRLFLPTRIKEVRFYEKPGSSFFGVASLAEVADSTVSGDIRILDEQGKLCGEVRGLTARLVESAGAVARESIDHWLYEYRWESKPREKVSAAGEGTVSVLGAPMPRGVLEEVKSRADVRSAETGWRAYYGEVEEHLNELATQYVVEAFDALGCALQPGVRLTPESLGTASPAGWRKSLAAQLLQMLERATLVRKSGGEWEATGRKRRGTALQLAEKLLREFPAHRLDVELLARCGPRLPDVLAGRGDGRDVFFTEEGFEFLERFYREAPASTFYNSLVGSLVSELTAHGDKTRALNVLEVGAGTGGTTSHLLPGLDASQVRYTYTDVSPAFLERARAKFSGYPFLTTKSFDVTKDPASQGIQPHSFDLIIGANVLHATPDLRKSLACLRELLLPGGLLLLLEITSHPYWLDIAFGLMDGWWKFEDRDLRPNHPLMSGSRWQGLMDVCGFEQTAIVADCAPGGEPAQSILLARKPAAETIVTACEIPDSRHWLIFADRRGIGNRVAELLRAKGQDCSLVFAGAEYRNTGANHFEIRPDNTEDAAQLLRDLKELAPRIEGVVHSWSIDIGAPPVVEDGFFANAQTLGCGSLMTILRSMILSSELNDRTLAIVTAGAQAVGPEEKDIAVFQSPVWGLGRTIFKELPGLRCRMVDLSSLCADGEVSALADEIISDEIDGAEEEIAFRGEDRLVHRLRATSLSRLADSRPLVAAAEEDGWQAGVMTTGSLDSLAFTRVERQPPGPDEVEFAINAASLNFRDIVLAMGVVPGLEADNTLGKKRLGSDFAGTITRCGTAVRHLQKGDEVLGIAPGSFASYAVTSSALVIRKPPALSVEQASAVPVAFVTAHYALRRLARLSAGESVLIHTASGGVGIAAIQIAHLAGATVFATAGSAAKRSYVESLGVTHVLDSRSLAFADQILELTGGRGVDVVLNSLPGEAMQKGISLLAPYGRFAELGKADIYQNHSMELAPFKRNLTLFAVDLDRMSLERPELVGEMLLEVVEQLNAGTLKPLPFSAFEMARLSDAMRQMALAKHIGKIVVTRGAPVAVRAPVPAEPPVRADATYLITGGLGGLGLEVARWLVGRGATALILIGRNHPSAEAESTINELRSIGARIEVLAADVSKGQDVSRIMEFVRTDMPALRGIFHAAMVLEDTPVSDLETGGLDRVMAPKVLGAWHLHRHSLGEALDFFVLFSSITSLLGNPNQANYAAANAFLDSFAAYRRAQGLTATTINWGVISGAGYVARHQEVGEYLAKQGYLSFTPAQTLDTMAEILKRDAVQVMAARIDWKRLGGFGSHAAASNRIRHLIPAADSDGQAVKGSIRLQIEQESPANRPQYIERYLRDQIGKLLGASGASLEVDRSLSELGLDSLIAAELTVVLHRDLGVEVAGSKLLGNVDLRGLAAHLLGLLRLEAVPTAGERPKGGEARRESIPVSLRPMKQSPVGNGDGATSEAIIANPSSCVRADFNPMDTAKPRVHTPVERDQSSAHNPLRDSVAASTAHNGFDYASLDYSRWSPAQQVVRAASIAGFRLLARVDTSGFENIPKFGPCLLAVNHLSMADVPLLLSLLPRRTIILANEKLQKIRLLDWFVSDMGHAIYVTPNELDEHSLQNALTVLEAGGLLALAPEGTRSRTGGLGRGRTGVAYLATRANVPVVPLVAWGQEKWRSEIRGLRRTRVNVRAGEPLHFPAGSAAPALLRQYTDRIMFALAELLPPSYRGVYAGAATVPAGDTDGELRRTA